MMGSSTSHTINNKLDCHLRDQLIVSGYIRCEYDRTSKNSFPSSLMDLCLLFYHIRYELLRFSSKYKTQQLVLSEDGRCLSDPPKQPEDYKWALVDIPAIKQGQHCWRFQINNPCSWWFSTCIAKANVHYPKDGTSGQATAYGVGTDPNWYPYTYRNQNSKAINHDGHWGRPKGLTKYHIDVLFNADIGELQLCVLEQKDSLHAKIMGVPTNTEDGYVPHFNTISLDKSQIRIANIPVEYYGEQISDIWPSMFNEALT